MKNKYSLLATALLVSMSSFAQKNEFKTLKKIYEDEKPSAKDVSNFKEALAAATPLVSSSNTEDQVYLNFYSAVAPFIVAKEAMSKPENVSNPKNVAKFLTPEHISQYLVASNAVLEYEKKSNSAVLSKKIEELSITYKPTILTVAISLGEEEKFGDAAKTLYNLYELDKSDLEKLYYAANYAVNANDYKAALEYYQILKDKDFSGEKMIYSAMSRLNNREEFFGTKAERDKAVKALTHTDPKEEKEPSKRGEIYKNIALILQSEGKIDEAKLAIQDARKANPDDTSLIMSEADIYLKTNDMATYSKLIQEVLQKDPNNADLYYNLGVISGQNKDNANAEKYYLKAIEISPDYANAYFNLAALKLDESQVILDQMNKLGTSAAENKKYDELKLKRENILKDSIVSLEKTVSLDLKNTEAKQVLLSVYKALEMKEKAKALEAEIEK